MLGFQGGFGELVTVAAGLVAGGLYFAVNTGLLAVALAVEGRENVWRVWHERFLWLAPHYLVYGFIGGVIAIGYHAAGLYALAVFAVPLLLMRKTQEAYLSHTRSERAEAAPGGRDDPHAERLARAGEPAAQGALDGGDGEPLGHGRRARRLYGRTFAPGAAARARDRS